MEGLIADQIRNIFTDLGSGSLRKFEFEWVKKTDEGLI